MRNSTRIRNLVELKARQEQERLQRERQRYKIEQQQPPVKSQVNSVNQNPNLTSNSNPAQWQSRLRRRLAPYLIHKLYHGENICICVHVYVYLYIIAFMVLYIDV